MASAWSNPLLSALCAGLAACSPAAAQPAASLAPADALDLLDARAPLPLLPRMALHQKQSMREHLEAVQQVVAALGAGDYQAVERAAFRIGYSEQMGQMCTHLGAAAPGFTEQALAFHRTADRIGAAARAKDRAKVSAALSETLQTCTACHAAWKQRVVGEAEWTRLSGAAAPVHGAK